MHSQIPPARTSEIISPPPPRSSSHAAAAADSLLACADSLFSRAATATTLSLLRCCSLLVMLMHRVHMSFAVVSHDPLPPCRHLVLLQSIPRATRRQRHLFQWKLRRPIRKQQPVR